jgi:hypothetical protein
MQFAWPLQKIYWSFSAGPRGSHQPRQLQDATLRAGLEAGASEEFQVKKSVECYCLIEKQWRHEHDTFNQ